jgi:hypothetical protein
MERIDKAEFIKGDKKRKRILSLCHQLPVSMELTFLNPHTGKRFVNMVLLDMWLCEHGPFKKPLNNHTVKELSHVIVQFENILQSYLKSI